MFFDLFILFIILILFFMLSMVWPPDSPWAPWWRTNKKTAKAICKLANIISTDVIYDLGCGDGEVLIQAAKLGAKGIGIEIDPFRVLVAKVRILKNNVRDKVNIKRNNFFNEDISAATVVIVYLVPKTLDRLKTKFLRELKPGVRVVSYKYEIDLPLITDDKRNDIRVYKIP